MVNLPVMEGVAALILAAGRSSRMGAFKPLLPFGGSTVIDACVDHLRGGSVETVVVVVSQDSNAEDLRRHLQESDVIIATNPDPTSEMSNSIACGVRQLPKETKALLITPADHPAVPSEVIARLIDEWQRGAQLVVPTFDQRGGHPVLIDAQFCDELLQLDVNLGLKGLFQAHPDLVRRLAVESKYIARDLDTWDDYRVLHEELFGVSPPEPAVNELK